MRKTLGILLGILLSVAPVMAQTTTVGGTVKDTGNQGWINAQLTFNLFNPSGVQRPVYCKTGLPVTVTQSAIAGTDANATYSISLPQNSTICPANTRWQLTVCPIATFGCFTDAPINATGTSLTYNVTPPMPQLSGRVTYGYATGEVLNPQIGDYFWNVYQTYPTGVCYQYTGGSLITPTWQLCGSAAKIIGDIIYAKSYATGGNGTSGSPWTGWESAVTLAHAGSTVIFSPGVFSTSSQLAMANGLQIQCTGRQQTIIESSYSGYTFVAASKTSNYNGNSISNCQLEATSASTNLVDADSILKFSFTGNLVLWTTNQSAGTVASNGVAIRFDSTQSTGYSGFVQDNVFEWCGICISFPAVSNSALGGGFETTVTDNFFENYSGIIVDIADKNANGGIDHVTLKNNYFAGVASEAIYDGGNATDIENNSFEPQVGFAGPDIIHSVTSCAGYEATNKVSGTSNLFSNLSSEANCQISGSPINKIYDSKNTTVSTPIPIQFNDGLAEWLFEEPESFVSPTGVNAVSYIFGNGSGNGSSLYMNGACLEWMDNTSNQRCVLQFYTDGNVYLQNNSSGNIQFTQNSTAAEIIDSTTATFNRAVLVNSSLRVTGYHDMDEIATPTNPGGGIDRLYLNNTSHQLSCLNSSGGNCMPETGIMSGTTGNIGGSALALNACSSGIATITGAMTGMISIANPTTNPNSGASQSYDWYAQITAANTVTVYECAIVAGTPAATTFNVRVIQ